MPNQSNKRLQLHGFWNGDTFLHLFSAKYFATDGGPWNYRILQVELYGFRRLFRYSKELQQNCDQTNDDPIDLWHTKMVLQSTATGRIIEIVNPYSVTFLIRTPILKWYVVCCGSKNIYQKDMCLKEIGLHAQNITTILVSIVNIKAGGGGGLMWPFNEHKNLHFDNKMFVWAPKITRGYGFNSNVLTMSYQLGVPYPRSWYGEFGTISMLVTTRLVYNLHFNILCGW